MRFVLVSFCLFLLLVPAAAVAQDDEDPIDAALGQCLDDPQGQSTRGMVECFGAAYQDWDAALNDVYDGLMHSLDPQSAALLKSAQRNWTAFRDAESDFLATLVVPERGTLMLVTVNETMTDLVRARVMELRAVADETADDN